MKQLFVLILLAVLSVGFLGCASSRLSTPMTKFESCAWAPRDAKQAIFSAAQGRRWVPKEISNDTIRCTLDMRGTHKVVVDVVYNKNDFSIRYVDSENMNYSREAGTINRKYNQWVANLQKDILSFSKR